MATILVVDDQALVRNHFERTLSAKGHQIVTAEHGRHGLDLANKTEFDLIFTDLNMPFFNGIEMIKKLRESEGPNQKTPVVMVSSDATMERKLKAKEAGATGWITKPIDADKLIKQTDAILNK